MLDNDEILTCPACGEKMDKVFINSIQKHIDVCLNGCGGMFLDNREFEKVDEAHEEVKEILNLFEGKEFKKVDDTEVRVCPYCGANMVKSDVFGVLIDTCYTCGAKFLDNKELVSYRSQYDTDAERSRVYCAMVKKLILQNNGQVDDSLIHDCVKPLCDRKDNEIIFGEPKMNPFKKFIVNLLKRY